MLLLLCQTLSLFSEARLRFKLEGRVPDVQLPSVRERNGSVESNALGVREHRRSPSAVVLVGNRRVFGAPVTLTHGVPVCVVDDAVRKGGKRTQVCRVYPNHADGLLNVHVVVALQAVHRPAFLRQAPPWLLDRVHVVAQLQLLPQLELPCQIVLPTHKIVLTRVVRVFSPHKRVGRKGVDARVRQRHSHLLMLLETPGQPLSLKLCHLRALLPRVQAREDVVLVLRGQRLRVHHCRRVQRVHRHTVQLPVHAVGVGGVRGLGRREPEEVAVRPRRLPALRRRRHLELAPSALQLRHRLLSRHRPLAHHRSRALLLRRRLDDGLCRILAVVIVHVIHSRSGKRRRPRFAVAQQHACGLPLGDELARGKGVSLARGDQLEVRRVLRRVVFGAGGRLRERGELRQRLGVAAVAGVAKVHINLGVLLLQAAQRHGKAGVGGRLEVRVVVRHPPSTLPLHLLHSLELGRGGNVRVCHLVLHLLAFSRVRVPLAHCARLREIDVVEAVVGTVRLVLEPRTRRLLAAVRADVPAERLVRKRGIRLHAGGLRHQRLDGVRRLRCPPCVLSHHLRQLGVLRALHVLLKLLVAQVERRVRHLRTHAVPVVEVDVCTLHTRLLLHVRSEPVCATLVHVLARGVLRFGRGRAIDALHNELRQVRRVRRRRRGRRHRRSRGRSCGGGSRRCSLPLPLALPPHGRGDLFRQTWLGVSQH
eukprot:Rhum_TRINITY_DN8609_c0_g1::Rhum_TRINITY_DN8609_c0_g1_i1::g.29062::m.29062